MRVLVACEFSGAVRDAFRLTGHDAWSCDLLPEERGSAFHHKRDVLELLAGGWDMMLAFPPCTHLASSGARWFKGKRLEQSAAVAFVRTLLETPIPRNAIENPIGYLSTRTRPPEKKNPTVIF